MFRGISWGLVRNPRIGRATSDEDIYAFPSTSFPDAPSIVIYYRFDSNHIELLSVIKAIEDDDIS